MKVALITAVAENNAIGLNNKMPWYIPGELAYFKKMTMGKPIIMGRKTFESLGKPLPGRVNIVITRDEMWKKEGVHVAHSLQQALNIAEEHITQQEQEVMVIGGAQIYQQVLPLTTKIYMTRVCKSFKADTFFPALNLFQWQETYRDEHETTEGQIFKYIYTVLEKTTLH